MAEAWVENVDGNGRFLGLRGVGGEFTAIEDFEEFGDVVSDSIISCYFSDIETSKLGMGVTYLSPILADSLLFNASNMFGLLFSGKLVKPCTSELTNVRWGMMLYFVALSRSLGKIMIPSRKVLMTLVVMVDSLPSTVLYSAVQMPAFSTTASSLLSPLAFWTNCLTDSKLERSSCHTSTTSFLFVDSSMDFLAASPFSTVRTARITLSASRLVKWRAASRPSPTFLP